MIWHKVTGQKGMENKDHSLVYSSGYPNTQTVTSTILV